MQQAASTKEPISPHTSLPKGKAKWAMILLLYAANVNVSFMQSSMNVALDTIASSFHLTLSIANWVVLGYAIIVATVITMTATILKRFGYRKVMLVSLIFAFAGSFLGFFAPNFPLLLAARLLQAVATGITFPLVNDALLRLAPDGKAGLLLSIDSGIIGLGLAIAPPFQDSSSPMSASNRSFFYQRSCHCFCSFWAYSLCMTSRRGSIRTSMS